MMKEGQSRTEKGGGWDQVFILVSGLDCCLSPSCEASEQSCCISRRARIREKREQVRRKRQKMGNYPGRYLYHRERSEARQGSL